MKAASRALPRHGSSSSSDAPRRRRDSNIELLRILCMLLIIAHHCVVHGSFFEAFSSGQLSSATSFFGFFILPAGKIGFVCFVAISMWFFVDKEFKADRFLKVWLEVLFYTVLLAFASWVCGVDMAWQMWVASLLPIGGNPHGFAATYLAFYLLLPFVSRATKGITKKQALWGVLSLVYIEVIVIVLNALGVANLALHPFPSEIVLFVMLYMLLFYLKHWPPVVLENRFALVGILAACWALTSVFYWSQASGRLPQGLAWLQSLCNDESSFLFISGGIALFFIFKGMKIRSNAAINSLASATLGILLLHDHNVFRPVFWDGVVGMPDLWLSPWAIVGTVVVSIAVYVVGFCIDKVRARYLEKALASTAVYRRVLRYLDTVFPPASRREWK